MENRFKEARTEHNRHGAQSTKEVEKETGVTKSLIEDIESTAGKPRNVGYLTVKKLAQHYGVSADYLLGISDTPSTKEDIQTACKTTGLSTSVIEWLKTITGDPAKIDALNSILDNKTFQAILPYIDELKDVQIAAEMNRLGPANEQVKFVQVKEISDGQYLVGGYEYLSVLEYRIAELLKIVIDEVTRPCLEELEGE